MSLVFVYSEFSSILSSATYSYLFIFHVWPGSTEMINGSRWKFVLFWQKLFLWWFSGSWWFFGSLFIIFFILSFIVFSCFSEFVCLLVFSLFRKIFEEHEKTMKETMKRLPKYHQKPNFYQESTNFQLSRLAGWQR